MHIGILSVRDGAYHPNNAGSWRRHAKWDTTVSLIHTQGLPLLTIQGGTYRRVILPDAELPDVLLPRVGATINDYALSVVRHFELSGTRVVNGFRSILMARNKFMGLQRLATQGVQLFPAHLPGGNPRRNSKDPWNSCLGGYPVVAKMPSSRQGNGV